MSGNFLNNKGWTDILRGYLYDAAMFYPSDTKRPLDFFIPDDDNDSRGTLIKDIGDFRPVQVDGKFRATEQKIIVTLKPRKVLVITNDELCQNENIEFVHIAPIMSIYDRDKSKGWYQKAVNDQHPFFVYLPKNITGRECYIDISEVASIHKSMLLRKLNRLPQERLEIVEETIIQWLDLGVYEEEIEIEKSDK